MSTIYMLYPVSQVGTDMIATHCYYPFHSNL